MLGKEVNKSLDLHHSIRPIFQYSNIPLFHILIAAPPRCVLAVSFFFYLYSFFCQLETASESDFPPKFPYCTVLHRRHFIDDALFKRAVAMLGEPGVIDLVAVSGYYTLVSMVLNVAEVPLPPGEKSPW